MQIGQESHSVLPTGHQETQDEKSAALEAQRIQKQGTLAREYEVLKHLSHVRSLVVLFRSCAYIKSSQTSLR